MGRRRRYSSSGSSSDEDFVPSDGEERQGTSNEIPCKRRRKQPERINKHVKALELFRRREARMFLTAFGEACWWRWRVEAHVEPRSQVLPKETLLDVFRCEDRETLECLQLVCGRFHRIVYTKMNGLCLRPICSVRLMYDACYVYAQVVPMRRGNKPTKRARPGPEIVYNANSIELATEWIFAGLRCAQVRNSFELHNVALSKHFLTQLKDAAPNFNVSGHLDLVDINFPDNVTPATLIGAFPGLSDVRTKSARLQWKHIDDALLRCYAEKGLWKSFWLATKGVEYDGISEKGILDFCFGYSEQARGSVRDLVLRKPRVTKYFVDNVLKAHQSCDHDDPILLEVADIPKQSIFDGWKRAAYTPGSFTAGDIALKVCYNAAEDTWFIQRGFE